MEMKQKLSACSAKARPTKMCGCVTHSAPVTSVISSCPGQCPHTQKIHSKFTDNQTQERSQSIRVSPHHGGSGIMLSAEKLCGTSCSFFFYIRHNSPFFIFSSIRAVNWELKAFVFLLSLLTFSHPKTPSTRKRVFASFFWVTLLNCEAAVCTI